MLYAVGRETPLFDWAFDWFPGVSLYRRPADATFLVNIMLALASGALLHRYIAEGLPSRRLSHPRWLAYLLPITVGGLVAILIGAGLSFSLAQDHLLPSLRELAISAGLTFCAAAIFILLRSRRRRALAAIILVAATGAELIWRDAAASFNAEPVSRYAIYAHLSQGDAAGLKILQQEIADKITDGDRPRIEVLGLSGAWQNASMVLRLENTLGYNPLRISDYARAVGPGENAEDPYQRHFPGTFRGYKCRLAALLGLEYLVLDRPLTNLPRHFPRPSRIQQIYVGDSMYIYRLGKAAARTYVATKIKPSDNEAVIDESSLPDFDRSNEALIDATSLGDLSAALLSANSDAANTHASITHYADNAVKIDVTTDKPGVVVLHDLYYPGWEVRVDGQKKPLLRTNILFRGVEVLPGHHEVEFSFHPLSLANLTAAAAGMLHRDEE